MRWIRMTKADAQTAVQVITEFLTQRPEIQSFRKLQILKISEQSWVFSGQINGEKVVLKRFLQDDPTARIRGLKAELDHLETVFGDGNCQANRCLMAWPDDGIVVLSFVPGQRLGDKISGSTGQKRQQLLRQSGEWLARYTASRQRSNTFAPAFWLNKLHAADLGRVADSADAALLGQLRAAMQAQIATLRGCDVVLAATHGDYVGINAHFHNGVIYGVDIQGESWFPIAKDAARFLVWLQIHDSHRPELRHSGIAAEYWDSFLQSGVLSGVEQKTTLPFFVGLQLYERYIENYHRPAIRQNTRAAIECYLQ